MISDIKQPELTAREMEILHMLAQGYRTSEIAKRLQLSYKSVAEMSKAIKSKLGVDSMIELKRLADRYAGQSVGDIK